MTPEEYAVLQMQWAEATNREMPAFEVWVESVTPAMMRMGAALDAFATEALAAIAALQPYVTERVQKEEVR